MFISITDVRRFSLRRLLFLNLFSLFFIISRSLLSRLFIRWSLLVFPIYYFYGYFCVLFFCYVVFFHFSLFVCCFYCAVFVLFIASGKYVFRISLVIMPVFILVFFLSLLLFTFHSSVSFPPVILSALGTFCPLFFVLFFVLCCSLHYYRCCIIGVVAVLVVGGDVCACFWRDVIVCYCCCCSCCCC